jgi:hypothetical protein
MLKIIIQDPLTIFKKVLTEIIVKYLIINKTLLKYKYNNKYKNNLLLSIVKI